MKTFMLLLTVLALQSGWTIQDSCREKITDNKMHRLQMETFISKINKPVDIAVHSTEGLLKETDFKYLGLLPPNQPFSVFDERYYKEVKHVLKLLLEAKDFDHFMATAEVLRERVNEDLLCYCFSVATLHRNDTYSVGVKVDPIYLVYPDKFFKSDVIKKIRKVGKYSSDTVQQPVIDATKESFNYMAGNDLSYFLEDIGLNNGHYQWHVIYPAVWWRPDTFERKGEHFYWMHKQMVNHYDAERASNGMMPVEPFTNWDEPIPDGFAPHLRIDKTGYRYAYRPRRIVLKDLKDLSKNKMLMWEEQLTKAALRGFAITRNGTVVELNNERGINILGEMVESSSTSVNKDLYGNLHSYAHVMTGKITDPKGVYDGAYGAMYDVATSARDPLFYSWHKYINRIFETHKNQLPPYTKEELEFKGVKVTNFNISGTEPNVVHTFWEVNLIRIMRGFTFTKGTAVLVKVKHLQHETFTYNIEYENDGPPKKSIVRIYAMPYSDFYKKMTFNQKRNVLIEMDVFITTLQSGKHTIVRSSKHASTFAHMEPSEVDNLWSSKYQCRCFWPEYLKLPKGNYEGMPFAASVVISDWEPKVEKNGCQCDQGASSCDSSHKVPFKRALGFPFDRRSDAISFSQFKTPNMARTNFKIQFTGKTTYHV